MKKNEKRLLDTFSDKSLQIDPKFKSSLRQRVTKTPRKKHWYAMPRLVWAPLAVLAILAISVFASTQQASAPHQNPFRPKVVSAQELVQKSDASRNYLDTSQYDFWKETWATVAGPMRIKCGDGSGGYTEQYQSSLAFTTYIYIDHQSGIEALYAYHEQDGQKVVDNNVLNRSGVPILEKGNWMPLEATPLSTTLENATTGGRDGTKAKDLYILQNGKMVRSDQLPEVQRDGHEVYEFYAVPIPDANIYSNCDQTIDKFVVDATSYHILEQSSYIGSIADNNLVEKSTASYQASKVDYETAINSMVADGYNIDHPTSFISDKGYDPSMAQ